MQYTQYILGHGMAADSALLYLSIIIYMEILIVYVTCEVCFIIHLKIP